MLDVHPPHHAVHAWRDFLIHIATIVVGLLIAIGLEQSVEDLHHAHQRRELLMSLQRDTQLCAQDSAAWARREDVEVHWLQERSHQVIDALSTGHALGQGPPEKFAEEGAEFPSAPQWEAGKASGLLQVLSPEDTEAYSEVSFMIQLSTNARNTHDAASARTIAFERSYARTGVKGPDFSKATPPELREYMQLLTEELITVEYLRAMSRESVGAASAVVKGERGLRKIQDAEIQANQNIDSSQPQHAP